MYFIYGFGPYDEFKDNVSAQIIEQLPDNAKVRSRIFDVLLDRRMFEEALDSARPQYILGLGQSRVGEKLRIETSILNAMAKRGEPLEKIDSAVEEQNRVIRWKLPQQEFYEVSANAGSYVCNFSMWVVAEWAERNNAQFAFIHVPREFDVDLAASYVQSILENLK